MLIYIFVWMPSLENAYICVCVCVVCMYIFSEGPLLALICQLFNTLYCEHLCRFLLLMVIL